ncbi:MAG: delta-class carbonic anhydrase [Bdellovibrionota bacterium]|nr:delta-class carbonic anhydrase [Bdellovibrionota bacterium]
MKLFISLMLSSLTFASVCQGYGPQTPRDITSFYGTNPVKFAIAPESEKLNLCNIHFHKSAEHKADGYSISAGTGKYGGWLCNETPDLTFKELDNAGIERHCENIQPGDTIEVHWVHTSCDVAPGPGLGSCLSDKCANPQLRVETKVFLLVNDSNALNFLDYDVKNQRVSGYYQADYPKFESPVEFRGSTTGPSFDEQTCSPLQATWSVQPSCEKLDIKTVHQWCKNNRFNEKEAHGVRQIVTSPQLLDQI